MVETVEDGYRLISYLVNKNKQNEMDSEILKCIQKEEESGGLLSLSEINAACDSAQSLRRVFERVLHGRLLRRIHAEFDNRQLRTDFYVLEWPRLRRGELA